MTTPHADFISYYFKIHTYLWGKETGLLFVEDYGLGTTLGALLQKVMEFAVSSMYVVVLTIYIPGIFHFHPK